MSEQTENVIEVNGITKKYDGFLLDNVSFNVAKGSIMGFIGQNGSGKSTTINAILNIIRTDSGNIKVFGMDNRKHETEIKKHISAVFDELPFHDELNADALNKIFRDIYFEWNSEIFWDSASEEEKIRAVFKGYENEIADCCGSFAQCKTFDT